jgi:hypothetical protein
MATDPPPDRIAEAKAKQAAEDYEFERPWRDMVGAIRSVKSVLAKATAMAMIERCMHADRPTT